MKIMQRYNLVMVYSPDKNRLLLCKRTKDPYKGLLNLPGGKVENGEDGLAAAYRELFEETGITREDIAIKRVMDFVYYNQDCASITPEGKSDVTFAGANRCCGPALRGTFRLREIAARAIRAHVLQLSLTRRLLE